MLRNIAFSDLDATPDDDDDPLLPSRSLSRQPWFHATSTLDSPKLDDASIHKMDMDKQVQTPTQQEPASISFIESDSNQPIEPLIAKHPTHFQPQRRYRQDEGIDSQSDDQSDDLTVDARLRADKKPLKFRNPDLLANMIENGDQCNVRNTAHQTSKAAEQPLPTFLINLMASTKFDDNMKSQLMEDEDMILEIDKDNCAGRDEGAGANGSTTLRDAEGPAGIRKPRALKYRSSKEAAAQCKNMRHSVPRMRRRPKTHQSGSTSSRSESRASASSNPPLA